ncbi:MAG: tellurite resistance TerB family protein [Deltaproteobacteria bacterium]|nr:tellurite resistance TerB family protein [Deltaproteobacteria bacterium]
MESEANENLERLKESASSWLGEPAAVGNGALIETAFLMAAADGELSDIEREQLIATIEYISNRQTPREQLDETIDQLIAALEADGWEERIRAVASSLEDPIARRNAYRLAAGISFIDGEVQEEEARLFSLLAAAFEIPSEEAERILVEVRDELFPPVAE